MTKVHSKKTLRDFGLLVGLTFPILIGLIIPFLTGHNIRIWTIFFSLPLILLALVSPRMLYYPYKIWMKIGFILGYINSRIILGAVFIFILQPIAFIMKLFKYDPLRLRKSGISSYRELPNQKTVNLKRIF